MATNRKALTLYDDYREMMADGVRMNAYATAIGQAVKPDDVVVDLGAGLGILSLLALRAGAKKVYAIEKGSSIHLARKVARVNGLEDRIVFLEQSSKEAELPELADVLVSETLGSFGVEENTLGFTLDARARLLRPGGRMVPQGLELYLAPVEHASLRADIDFWRDVQGFDFSPARAECASRMQVASVLPSQLLAEAALFAKVDLRTFEGAELSDKALFPITRPGSIHGLAGWFRARLSDQVTIDTAPGEPATHWHQAFFPLRETVPVVRGDHLEVQLSVHDHPTEIDSTTIDYDYRCTQIAQQQASVAPRVPRNAPCPCGSGKKAKRCCQR